MPAGMTRTRPSVVVAGGSGDLGTRVLAALVDATGRPVEPSTGPPVEPSTSIVDLDRHRDPAAVLAGLGPDDTLVLLGRTDELGPEGLPAPDPGALRKDLEAAPEVGHLVALSSAMAYGAWPSNPVPLTEEAPLQPDVAFGHAADLVEVERLVGEWRLDHPGATAAVLRPAVTVDAGSAAWLALSPWSARALRAGGSDRPSQFVHTDDVAAAVAHAAVGHLDGPFDVAPDGWLSRDALADLAGPVGRVHLPPSWVARARDLGRRLGVQPAAAVDAYAQHAWVVANDRLTATGWVPAHRNDEVYVEADPGGPLADLSPRRRQELSLGLVAAAAMAVVGGAVWFVRRRTRAGRVQP